MSHGLAQPLPSDGGLVLLVEDHQDSRELYVFDLERSGFRVDGVATAAQAMERLAMAIPDVVVTDLKLPDGDGLQLCQRLRASPATKDVPVIAVTACVDTPTLQAAREAGCAAVLLKPCAPADLRLEVQQVVAASRRIRQDAMAARLRALALSGKSIRLTAKSKRIQRLGERADGVARADSWLDDLTRVRAEFQGVPRLRLSAEQAARFLGVDTFTATRVLERLVADGVLKKTAAGVYRLSV